MKQRMSMPSARKASVETNAQAAALYRSLGKDLMLAQQTQHLVGITPAWRKDAVQVRQDLRREYGEQIREKDVPYYARQHVTIPKPTSSRTSIVQFSPDTREVTQITARANPKQLVLPSASSAMALIEGEPSALPRVIAHLLGRACLIGVGIYAMGGGKSTPKMALGGSMAIEAFVLYCAWQQATER